MRLSHSALSLLLDCPASYFLSYHEGIQKIETKPAFIVGSAMHYGLEVGSSDLTQYFKDNDMYDDMIGPNDYQILAEAMAEAVLKNKDNIFDRLLTDGRTGKKAKLIKEDHELRINGKLTSFMHKEPHDFVGIIDLLLTTDEGFVLVDWKTSTMTPDWEGYLDQIYRYIFLLKSEFPDIPVRRIAIVNVRKSKQSQKRGESREAFAKRVKDDYVINFDKYIFTHIYDPEDLDKDIVDSYIKNLSRMADAGETIDKEGRFYINYASANGKYGKSDYWDIFYHTPHCCYLYDIKDTILDGDILKVGRRPCVEIDMHVLDKKVLNKYEDFKSDVADSLLKGSSFDKNSIFSFLKRKYDEVDDDLLEEYWKMMAIELNQNNQE